MLVTNNLLPKPTSNIHSQITARLPNASTIQQLLIHTRVTNRITHVIIIILTKPCLGRLRLIDPPRVGKPNKIIRRKHRRNPILQRATPLPPLSASTRVNRRLGNRTHTNTFQALQFGLKARGAAVLKVAIVDRLATTVTRDDVIRVDKRTAFLAFASARLAGSFHAHSGGDAKWDWGGELALDFAAFVARGAAGLADSVGAV